MAAQDEKKDIRDAIQWLSDGAPRADIVPQREPGTCEWMNSNQQFQEWLKTERGTCLWIHGIPGKMHWLQPQLI